MKNPEQEKPGFRVTRRTFLLATAAVGLGAIGGEKLRDIEAEYRYELCQEALTFRSLPYEKPVLIDRGGMGFNIVFSGLRSPESFNRTLDYAVDNRATFLRGICDCSDNCISGADYEPELGTYREKVLSGFTQFCEAAAARDLSLIIVLSDGYRMGPCLRYNPVYSSRDGEKILSPYYVNNAAGGPWSHFYTDKDMVEAYLRRAGRIVGAVREAVASQLTAGRIRLYFEPMNEPSAENVTEMNNWLTLVSEQLKENYGVACLSGVADPDTVTNPDIPATVHYYPSFLDKQEERIKTLISGRNVLFEEGGEMSRLFGIGLDHDTRLRNYLTVLYFQTNRVDWRA